MASELLSLVAKIGIDDSEYTKGLSKAESNATKFGKGLKTAFKVSTAAVVGTATAVVGLSTALYKGVKQTAEYGDNVDKMSQKIGISAKSYQEWDYVMQRAGMSVDSLKMGMKTLSSQAENNSDAFQKLGISEQEVADLSKEDLFNKVISGLAEMEDGTERTALATQLLGRAGADMGPLLNQGTAAIEEQKRMAEDYGMVMSDEAVKAAAAFQDSATTLQMTATGLKNRLMGEFLPSITQITDGLALMFTRDGQEEGLEKFNQGITDTIDRVSELIPKVLEIGVPIVETIATGIIDNLPLLVNTAFTVIMDLGQYLVESAPNILTVGLTILLTLVQGITGNVDTLIPAVVSVIGELVTMLTEPTMLSQLIIAALDLMIALADGLVEAIPQLIDVVPIIFVNLVDAIIRSAPKLFEAAVKSMASFIKGVTSTTTSIGNAFNKIMDAIQAQFDALKDKALTWGKDMLQKFIDGIKEKLRGGGLKDAISGITGEISSKLHFSVPDEGPLADADKWMPDFMDLLSEGIDSNKYKVTNAIDGLAGDMTINGGYSNEETQKEFELRVADGTAPLLQVARLLFPYMQIVMKEKGAV